MQKTTSIKYAIHKKRERGEKKREERKREGK